MRMSTNAIAAVASEGFRYCRYEKQGQVAYVTITRPEVMNALHDAAHHELSAIWDDFEADDALRVAVLTGEGGRAFCAGRDLKDSANRSRAGERRNSRPATGGGG